MEQTVAKAIIASMTSCSDFKPKYPYVNAHKSALLYVGYHLKGQLTVYNLRPLLIMAFSEVPMVILHRFNNTTHLLQYPSIS